ncbi:hypothetical protein WDZ17_05955 [Pseudokineococcus basanitobsidens]|uniref:DUF8094 domain-containing protein n=1 Tax=Pseudokineococcus basanitobsidens TaxID=1926649 RepID=A0ABU8RIC9_9ACTN
MSRRRTTTRSATTRAGALGGAGVALAVLLGGCADAPLPEPQPQEVAGAYPAVTAEESASVHEAVAADAAEADAARDASLLEPRVAGSAAELRAARYRLQELLPDAPAPSPLGGTVERDVVPAVTLPGAQEGETPGRAVAPAEAAATFPRAWTTITQADGGVAPQLSVLVQEDARSPYRVVTTTPLLPGAVVPETLAPEEGVAPLAPDAGGLVLSPQDAVGQYASALGDPDAPEAARFADDPFRQVLLQERAAADAVEFFSLATSRSVRPGSVVATPTADGGALVVGVMESRSVQAVEEDGAVLTLSEPVAALAETQEARESAAVSWLEVVALAVPPAPADGEQAQPVRVVGADRVLSGAQAR